MHLDVIPRKTDRARAALQQRDALARNQRLFLIMVDGRKSLRDPSDAATQLGIDSMALAVMVNAGLVEWRRDDVKPESALSQISEGVERVGAPTPLRAPAA